MQSIFFQEKFTSSKLYFSILYLRYIHILFIHCILLSKEILLAPKNTSQNAKNALQLFKKMSAAS